MLSHLCPGTNDFARAYAFYTDLLGELGLVQKFHDPTRPWADSTYYGAYFRDLDGNKLCVCCHEAE